MFISTSAEPVLSLNRDALQSHGASIANAQWQGHDFNLIHISDLHLGRQFYREHYRSFKLLLRAIADEECDHLLITGDIASTPDIDDLYLAREILAKAGFSDSTRLTVVPGNHDIFGGPHRATDVLSFPKYIRNVDYQRHLEMFLHVFEDTFAGAEYIVPSQPFPFVKCVGPYALIGFNSILPWSLRKNPFGSNGQLCETQFKGLESLVGSPLLDRAVPIAVMHHHFNDFAKDASTNHTLWELMEYKTMRMRKRKKTLKLFNSLNVRYIMHGHIHKNEIYEKEGITLANGAGAVCDDPIQKLKYNRLLWTNGTCKLSICNLPVPYQQVVMPLNFLHTPHPSLTFATKAA